MSNNKKNGITMASLVVYVIIFSVITTLLSIVYTNMNEKLLSNRGRAINYTELNKFQYNLEISAVNSDDVMVSDNIITYSNGDIYFYDEEKKLIMLNGGILCNNVTSFVTTLLTDDETKQLRIEVAFKKYGNELNKNIVSSIEVE